MADAEILGNGPLALPDDLTVAGNVGFYGADAHAKPTVTGSKGANAALTSLIAALVAVGLITDTTS